MKRILFGFVVASLLATGVAFAYRNFEQITVAGTSIGFTAAKITAGASLANWAVCRLETAQIRFRTDGGTPTSSVGTLLEIGSTVTLTNRADVVAFRAIRTGSSSGSLACTYGD